ncbi:hypothetical protein RB195_009865 [Necator americanus]|uniref:Uncharacterized protein n=1 Tax=Necator americanus TaxID=51031 RepID=A0ABR1CXQ6_NECAM
MSDVSNSFSAWETLPEDEPPLCIAVRRPVSPPRHYEARKKVWKTERIPIVGSKRHEARTITQVTALGSGAVETAVGIEVGPWRTAEVDSSFAVWLRNRRINVKGRTAASQEDTTVLRDVILAGLFIIFYYYCLTSFILPAYFNYTVPTKNAQAQEPTVMYRSDNEEAIRTKKSSASASADQVGVNMMTKQRTD